MTCSRWVIVSYENEKKTYTKQPSNCRITGPRHLAQALRNTSKRSFKSREFITVGAAERIAASRAQVWISLFCRSAVMIGLVNKLLHLSVIRDSLNNWSVLSSGAHFPGTQAREKKFDTAANSCSMTGLTPVQSGLINLSVINCVTGKRRKLVN